MKRNEQVRELVGKGMSFSAIASAMSITEANARSLHRYSKCQPAKPHDESRRWRAGILRHQGFTWAAIGKQLGCTRQAAQQLANYHSKEPHEFSGYRPKEGREMKQDQIKVGHEYEGVSGTRKRVTGIEGDEGKAQYVATVITQQGSGKGNHKPVGHTGRTALGPFANWAQRETPKAGR